MLVLNSLSINAVTLVENTFSSVDVVLEYSSRIISTKSFGDCGSFAKNFVSINSKLCPEFNKSAHVTFVKLSWGINDNVAILKDGFPCLDCENITIYKDGNLSFDVTSFSNHTSVNATNCRRVNESISLIKNVASGQHTCFTINNSNVVLDCQNFLVNSQGPQNTQTINITPPSLF